MERMARSDMYDVAMLLYRDCNCSTNVSRTPSEINKRALALVLPGKILELYILNSSHLHEF